MSEQERKKCQRIYDLLNAETKPKFLYRIKSKENCLFIYLFFRVRKKLRGQQLNKI